MLRFVSLLVFTLAISEAANAQTTPLRVFGDWSVNKVHTNDDTLCVAEAARVDPRDNRDRFQLRLFIQQWLSSHQPAPHLAIKVAADQQRPHSLLAVIGSKKFDQVKQEKPLVSRRQCSKQAGGFTA